MKQGRKISGGKYHASRKSRLYDKQTQETIVTLGETKSKSIRSRGGHYTKILLKSNKINISDGKKIKKTDITNVIETPQNKFWARQNRLTKGAIVETPMGKARITNRPAREGMINAVLIEPAK